MPTRLPPERSDRRSGDPAEKPRLRRRESRTRRSVSITEKPVIGSRHDGEDRTPPRSYDKIKSCGAPRWSRSRLTRGPEKSGRPCPLRPSAYALQSGTTRCLAAAEGRNKEPARKYRIKESREGRSVWWFQGPYGKDGVLPALASSCVPVSDHRLPAFADPGSMRRRGWQQCGVKPPWTVPDLGNDEPCPVKGSCSSRDSL